MSLEVMLIDDERAMRDSISQWLDLADCRVQSHATAAAALAGIERGFGGVVVSDLKMPGMDGMALLQQVLEIDDNIPVVLITGHGDINSAVEAMRCGAYDFIEKPFKPERLLSTVRRASEKRQLVLRNRQLQTRLDSNDVLDGRLLGNCSQMAHIRDRIREFAPLDVNVLLIGETGTGKEVIAHALHDLGTRVTHPFQAIDCGALAADRVERELFGEAGDGGTASPFERASGGTVLLDEISNMPLDQQVKLLRVLEQREVNPVGDSAARSFDVRLVSAASEQLPDALEQGGFRRDLYFRLNTIEIRIPPLRERDDDCVLLFEHFVRRAAVDFGRDCPAIDARDVTALHTHQWPGNVRELKNLAERFVLYQDRSVAELLQQTAPPRPRRSLHEQVQAFEKSVIEYALQQTDGKLQAAAEYLDVPRRTLNDKIQRHDIERDG